VVLAINLLLIYTGFGVFMGLTTIGVFMLESYRSWREATPSGVPLAGLFIACISLGSFFTNYTFQTSVSCFEFPHHDLSAYPWFMTLMFSTFSGIGSPLGFATVLGSAALLAGVWILIDQLRRLLQADQASRRLHLTLFVMLTYSLLFCVNTAIGRVCLGLPAHAQSSRYATLLIPAFLALYFYTLTVRSTAVRNGVVGLLTLALIQGHLHVAEGPSWMADGKRAWVSCYLATEDIAYCDSTTKFPIYPDPERTQLKKKLDYLKDRGLNLFSGQQ
jgi:hypothetical protein